MKSSIIRAVFRCLMITMIAITRNIGTSVGGWIFFPPPSTTQVGRRKLIMTEKLIIVEENLLDYYSNVKCARGGE